LDYICPCDSENPTIITKPDAANLAAVLEQALPDIPEYGAIASKNNFYVSKVILHETIEEIKSQGIKNPDDARKAYFRTLEQKMKEKPQYFRKSMSFEEAADGGWMQMVMPFNREANWDSLNRYEKLAGAQKKIKEFIAYLRIDGCQIH
jgi:hypothetical protein